MKTALKEQYGIKPEWLWDFLCIHHHDKQIDFYRNAPERGKKSKVPLNSWWWEKAFEEKAVEYAKKTTPDWFFT